MRIFKAFFFFIFILALAGGLVFYWVDSYYHSPTHFTSNGYVIVEKGASVGKAMQSLKDAGILSHPRVIEVVARYYKKNNIKFGEYQFTPDLTPEQIVDKLVKGETILRKVSIPEGKTVYEIFAILRAAEKLKITIDDAALPPEGSLMPSTYVYHYGDTDSDLVSQMQRGMNQALADEWEKRDPNLPITTPAEALTLASIVEKETGIESERPMVAGVFINRLNKHMKLESDPTAVYGITHGAPLGHIPNGEDVRNNNPYNTYIITALPPGPICNPGKAAIHAVLHPAATDALYFVATGSGGHNFASDIKQHQQNVQKLKDYLKNKVN